MELRSLVIACALLAFGTGLPVVVVLVLLGHVDVARGVFLGLLVGLANSLLLARKFGRVIDGRDPWQSLKGIMRRNMLLRFALIVASGAVAAHTPGVSVTGMAGGIVLYLVVSVIYSSGAVLYSARNGVAPPA
jgi:hypothetical protein